MTQSINIKHIPYGISPYETKCYQRIPPEPRENEPVAVEALLRGCLENVDARVIWKLNGREMPFIPAVIRESESADEWICHFELGDFRCGDQISYHIGVRQGETLAESREYRFAIPYVHRFSSATSIFPRERSVLVVLKDEEFCIDTTGANFEEVPADMASNAGRNNLSPCLQFNFTDTGLQIQYCTAADTEALPDGLRGSWNEAGKVYQDTGSGCLVEFQLNPFGFKVKNAEGISVLEFGKWDVAGESEDFIELTEYPDGHVENLRIHFETPAMHFYGFGERYDGLDQAGKSPDTYVFNQYCRQQQKTYMPQPFFMTEQGFGVWLNTPMYSRFSLPGQGEKGLTMEVKACPSDIWLDMRIFFGAPLEIQHAYITETGKAPLPPKWAFGPWMSSNGWNTQQETLEQLECMKRFDITATVLVLEAWSDEATFYIFNDAHYTPVQGEEHLSYKDFSFEDSGKWPDPKGLADQLHKAGLKLILWQIPVVKYFKTHEIEQHKMDEEYVIKKKYCVMNPDGTPYRISYDWFGDALLLDFTNPEAKQWWFERRRYLIDELGVDGFKTDGGEFVYDREVCFYNGMHGTEMRNLYPVSYISAYHDFAGPQRVLFSRAGYTGCQKFPMCWAGDQLSTYEEFRSVLSAGLTAGISGYPYWGYDISGFAGDMPDTELYVKSAQMAVFSPVMQFHSDTRKGYNNDRSPWNMARFTGDHKILDIYRRLANIRMNLLPYIYQEAKYASETREAMMRAMFLDFPQDPEVWKLEDQFMFGRSLLVAPLLEEGCSERKLYLPEGKWLDFWDGSVYHGGTRLVYGNTAGNIPVFIRDGAVIPLNLNHEFELGGAIGNELQNYCNLCLLVAEGFQGEYVFEDDMENRIWLGCKDSWLQVNMTGKLQDVCVIVLGEQQVENGEDMTGQKKPVRIYRVKREK